MVNQMVLSFEIIQTFLFMEDSQFQNSSSHEVALSKSNHKIQARQFILIYPSLISKSIQQVQQWFRQRFQDENLKIMQSSWNQSSQIFYIHLKNRRKFSVQKWIQKLQHLSSSPSFFVYAKSHYQSLTSQYSNHYPEKYSKKLKQLIDGQKDIADLVNENPLQIKQLNKLVSNIQGLRNYIREKDINKKRFPKKRGYWFIGAASSGKTSLAFKIMDEPYCKEMTSRTFDGYQGETNILFDDMNQRNGRILIPLLKNLINVRGYRFDIKFSTAYINPELVIVTTQYHIDQLTKDVQLQNALRQRFYFFKVTRDQNKIQAIEFSRQFGDITVTKRLQLIYSLKFERVFNRQSYQEQLEREEFDKMMINSI